MNDKKWSKLASEMEYLMEKGVSAIHPCIVLSYMDFLEQGETIYKVGYEEGQELAKGGD